MGLQLPEKLPVGVAMGMAWTPVGGEVLIIESLKMPGWLLPSTQVTKLH